MAYSPSREDVPVGEQQVLGDTSQCFGSPAFCHATLKERPGIHEAAHHPSFRTSHFHVL